MMRVRSLVCCVRCVRCMHEIAQKLRPRLPFTRATLVTSIAPYRFDKAAVACSLGLRLRSFRPPRSILYAFFLVPLVDSCTSLHRLSIENNLSSPRNDLRRARKLTCFYGVFGNKITFGCILRSFRRRLDNRYNSRHCY